MSRTLRPQMPGVAFHITARTQGKAPWFDLERHGDVPESRASEILSAIEEVIVEGVTTSDARLIAHTVMPNHYHIVLRQAAWPLGRIMQPMQRRIALLVQRINGVKGHVFERPFRSYACENADYLRRSIVYTHINAYRAKLCTAVGDYQWTSHNRLLTEDCGSVTALEIVHTLKLFSASPLSTTHQLRDNYIEYVNWRIAKDEHDAAEIPYDVPEPYFGEGDKHFATSFCAFPPLNRIPQIDLRDKALDILFDIDPNVSIEHLRIRNVSRALCAIRRQLICALHQYGFRGKQIAQFLRISETNVSAVAIAMRYRSVV